MTDKAEHLKAWEDAVAERAAQDIFEQMGSEFWWYNRFNGIEKDGPFHSANEAKAAAVQTMNHVQGGFAFDIVIGDSLGRICAEGHIKGGKWVDGEFSETDAERRVRLGQV